MSEPASIDEELRALQMAAERDDVNDCWSVTQRLLLRLPTHQVLRLVRDFVARHLAAFERHQPGVQWPREFIQSVSEKGTADDGRIWPEQESDFPGPGANSFIGAVEELWRAGHLMDDVPRRTQRLADAIERAVSAWRLESWGSRHPDAWARWYQLASTGSDDMSQYDTLLTIKRDPEARRVAKEAWLEAARCLEEALNASAPEPQ